MSGFSLDVICLTQDNIKLWELAGKISQHTDILCALPREQQSGFMLMRTRSISEADG